MSKQVKQEQLRVDSLAGWTGWLEEHHDQKDGIWLVFKKKGSGPVPFSYPEALEEALCYGWVDSLLKSIDEHEYMRKFSPRKPSSTWSELNKKYVARLTGEGRMKPPGLKAVELAKKNGMWDKGVQPPQVDDSLPGALLRAFEAHPRAREHYFRLAARHQKQYNIWINMAKRPETVQKRVDEAISLLEEGRELGLR
jgi:uncharacterized protein YdeI (YjbR/CyaY-like superfamily)